MELGQECGARSPSYAQTSLSRTNSDTETCPQIIVALRYKWMWVNSWPQIGLGKSLVSLMRIAPMI